MILGWATDGFTVYLNNTCDISKHCTIMQYTVRFLFTLYYHAVHSKLSVHCVLSCSTQYTFCSLCTRMQYTFCALCTRMQCNFCSLCTIMQYKVHFLFTVYSHAVHFLFTVSVYYHAVHSTLSVHYVLACSTLSVHCVNARLKVHSHTNTNPVVNLKFKWNMLSFIFFSFFSYIIFIKPNEMNCLTNIVILSSLINCIY